MNHNNSERSDETPPARNDGDKGKWYEDGLKFSCTGCGDCCTGAPGFVWVNKEEIRKLAARVDLSVDKFMKVYVRRVGLRYSLKEYSNGDCVFFDSQKRSCTVYEDRPRQCRTWPFWDSNLKTSEAWQRTCDVCPGSGNGKLYSLENIEQQRQVIRI